MKEPMWHDGKTLAARLIIYAVRAVIIFAVVGVAHIADELFNGSSKGCIEKHCDVDQ